MPLSLSASLSSIDPFRLSVLHLNDTHLINSRSKKSKMEITIIIIVNKRIVLNNPPKIGRPWAELKVDRNMDGRTPLWKASTISNEDDDIFEFSFWTAMDVLKDNTYEYVVEEIVFEWLCFVFRWNNKHETENTTIYSEERL
ncbi:hypothetical protein RFI_16105 [Reticulomyxa filosa]|uniref:Uncharacterized protein n=1 Tax=Reticulomyxa filosa TaxID=46433 RepID=X6N489_RETFI|nr:hypothetical protein RFI_16105 [Reticulomyxa filosa]|eukprot:ETO21100.1 hypothetical protein RFI_16105 [Reticulomyxa filosa]